MESLRTQRRKNRGVYGKPLESYSRKHKRASRRQRQKRTIKGSLLQPGEGYSENGSFCRAGGSLHYH